MTTLYFSVISSGARNLSPVSRIGSLVTEPNGLIFFKFGKAREHASRQWEVAGSLC
jgi:hypothetical protein